MKFVFFNKIYNSALFLDRDGVINKDLGYVHTKDKFILCQGIVEVIRYCNSIEIPVFITSAKMEKKSWWPIAEAIP